MIGRYYSSANPLFPVERITVRVAWLRLLAAMLGRRIRGCPFSSNGQHRDQMSRSGNPSPSPLPALKSSKILVSIAAGPIKIDIYARKCVRYDRQFSIRLCAPDLRLFGGPGGRADAALSRLR